MILNISLKVRVHNLKLIIKTIPFFKNVSMINKRSPMLKIYKNPLNLNLKVYLVYRLIFSKQKH